MTSKLVIFSYLFILVYFFSSPDPKSEKKYTVNQLIKKKSGLITLYFCFLYSNALQEFFSMEANSLNPYSGPYMYLPKHISKWPSRRAIVLKLS